jgi:hypothetical protein
MDEMEFEARKLALNLAIANPRSALVGPDNSVERAGTFFRFLMGMDGSAPQSEAEKYPFANGGVS